MKKLLLVLSVLAVLATVFAVSCKKEPVAKDVISINPNTWTCSYKGESLSLAVAASGKYYNNTVEKWISVSGNTITVETYYGCDDRSGVVTFTCGEASETLTITQKGAGPKDVVSEMLNALVKESDSEKYVSFYDVEEEQKAAIKEYLAEKFASIAPKDMADDYEILSETIDKETQIAEVVYKYHFPDGTVSSENKVKLHKKDGRWLIMNN